MKFLTGLALSLVPLFVFAGPVNVNTADAETLSNELVGIGLAKARAIVAYRDEHGAFQTPEELIKVKGIGSRVMDANRGNIRVED